jgi:streptogrisin C
MRKITFRARRGLLVLSPLALMISMAASAATAPTARDAMKRDLGMTDAQVTQYLKVERLADTQGRALAQAQGAAFAGSWIERTPSGGSQFVVATTSSQPQKMPAGVVLRPARFSLARLDANKAELDKLNARAPAGVYGWGVDVRTNTVRVDVARGALKAAIDFIAASGIDADTVRFSRMDSAPKPLLTFYGGSEYLSEVDGSYYYCSVGFNVTRSGVQGFATAGHCGNTGSRVYTLANRRTLGPQVGVFEGSTFGGNNGDKAWVSVGNSHSLPAVVDGYSSADVPVRGNTVAAIGAAVCRSGRTTGWKCGTMEAYNQTVNYPDVSVNGLTQVKVCAEGGDSGGAFITPTTGMAQGVLSGGNYSCKGKQANLATSYFQPINGILSQYNLTLKTQ